MKSTFIFFLLFFLLAPRSMNLTVRTSEAGDREEIRSSEMCKKSEDLTIRRDPFLDPGWLKKKREEEEKRKAEQRRRREAERKKQMLKLKGILQVGNHFVAIVDDKTLREGDVIRGRKMLEVSRSGIKILSNGKVREIPWKPRED